MTSISGEMESTNVQNHEDGVGGHYSDVDKRTDTVCTTASDSSTISGLPISPKCNDNDTNERSKCGAAELAALSISNVAYDGSPSNRTLFDYETGEPIILGDDDNFGSEMNSNHVVDDDNKKIGSDEMDQTNQSENNLTENVQKDEDDDDDDDIVEIVATKPGNGIFKNSLTSPPNFSRRISVPAKQGLIPIQVFSTDKDNGLAFSKGDESVNVGGLRRFAKIRVVNGVAVGKLIKTSTSSTATSISGSSSIQLGALASRKRNSDGSLNLFGRSNLTENRSSSQSADVRINNDSHAKDDGIDAPLVPGEIDDSLGRSLFDPAPHESTLRKSNHEDLSQDITRFKTVADGNEITERHLGAPSSDTDAQEPFVSSMTPARRQQRLQAQLISLRDTHLWQPVTTRDKIGMVMGSIQSVKTPSSEDNSTSAPSSIEMQDASLSSFKQIRPKVYGDLTDSNGHFPFSTRLINDVKEKTAMMMQEDLEVRSTMKARHNVDFNIEWRLVSLAKGFM